MNLAVAGFQHLEPTFPQSHEDFTFAAVRREYERAVDQLSPADEATDGTRDPTTMLAQHLMLLYCWGELALEDPDGLLRRFFDNAGPGHRAHALGHIGTLIGGGDIPAAVRQRLQDLWTYRLEQAQAAAGPHTHGGEMEAFGWWFLSDVFDDRWAIEQLLAALRVHPRTEMDDEVLSRLADRSADHPLLVVSCAQQTCEGDGEGWLISSGTKSLKQVLKTAISSGDAAARQTGHALISYLASRGFDDFRGLLPAA